MTRALKHKLKSIEQTAIAYIYGPPQALNHPKGAIAIYELKVLGKVHRIMTYVHDDKNQTPVLLFDFEGHKGKSGGGIKSSTLIKGQQYAEIARSLLREEL